LLAFKSLPLNAYPDIILVKEDNLHHNQDEGISKGISSVISFMVPSSNFS
jgi:hypothetical protein